MSDEPRFAHKVKKPFKWINAASHNDGGAAFHARQMERIAQARKDRSESFRKYPFAPTKVEP